MTAPTATPYKMRRQKTYSDAREEPVRGTVMMKELRKDVHDAETEAGDNAAETSNAAYPFR